MDGGSQETSKIEEKKNVNCFRWEIKWLFGKLPLGEIGLEVVAQGIEGNCCWLHFMTLFLCYWRYLREFCCCIIGYNEFNYLISLKPFYFYGRFDWIPGPITTLIGLRRRNGIVVIFSSASTDRNLLRNRGFTAIFAIFINSYISLLSHYSSFILFIPIVSIHHPCHLQVLCVHPKSYSNTDYCDLRNF